MITIKVDTRNVMNMLRGYEKTLPTGARRGVWNVTQRLQKELREEIRAKNLIWRGKLLKETQARKLSKNIYGIFMPYYGRHLDTMPTHWVPLRRDRLITQWAQTSPKSPWKGESFSELPRAIQVHRHPFIDKPLNKVRRQARRIITKEINRVIGRKGR